MLKRRTALYICLLLAAFGFSQKEAWKLKKEENGIAVYSRKTANSDFRELKSVGDVQASLHTIVALLYDFENYTEWVYRCGKSSTLKKINDTTVVHYQTVMAPWPVDNRDFIVILQMSQNKKTGVVTITSTCDADYIPAVKDHVRITKFAASWILTPSKNNTVEVVYQLLVDPGGNVPAWLVNMAAVDGPYETMLKLKEEVKKKK
ncbi:MAG: START domain-containing protein, partial [Bacteroidia bacterium]